MTTVYHDSKAANTDDGAITISLKGKSNARFHQVAIDISVSVGKFEVRYHPLGLPAGVRKKLSTDIDLTDATKFVLTFECITDELHITPNGVAANTAYTIGIAGMDS